MNHLCQYKTYTIGPLLPSVGVSGVGEEAPLDGEAALRSISPSSAPIFVEFRGNSWYTMSGNIHSLAQCVHLEKFLILSAAKTLTLGSAQLFPSQVDK